MFWLLGGSVRRCSQVEVFLVFSLLSGTLSAAPIYPDDPFTDPERLAIVREATGSRAAKLVNFCAAVDDEDNCERRALDRTIERLLEAGNGQSRLRLLHLGDSHVAADYITRRIRSLLQSRYGDTGDGFSHPDQPWGFGGRRRKRSDLDWERRRVVDPGNKMRAFGFSGISIESKRKGARALYQVTEEDEVIKLYFYKQPKGARLTLFFDKKKLGTVDTRASKAASEIRSFRLPRKHKKGLLKIVASGKNARIFGFSFEKRTAPGVFYDSIGPVGADAQVYLELDRPSLFSQLRAHGPSLVTLMVGGNDALKIRKGWTTLKRVRKSHEDLIRLLKAALPEADCMLWSPMDSGRRVGTEIVSKDYIEEVRLLQFELAKKYGCGFWDMFKSMGGKGSISAWAQAKSIQRDLIHPRQSGADLLGVLFSEGWNALVRDYTQGTAH